MQQRRNRLQLKRLADQVMLQFLHYLTDNQVC
jgi:uncharacterized protein YjiS (DUF1127 family)